MNRFLLLGSQFDPSGQEWAYVFDSQTGETFKSPVRTAGTQVVTPVVPTFTPAPGAFTAPPAPTFNAAPVVKQPDPLGSQETPEERKARLGQRKVPPVFLGDISKMSLDPSKTDGRTDVTPTH